MKDGWERLNNNTIKLRVFLSYFDPVRSYTCTFFGPIFKGFVLNIYSSSSLPERCYSSFLH